MQPIECTFSRQYAELLDFICNGNDFAVPFCLMTITEKLMKLAKEKEEDEILKSCKEFM